MRLTYEMVEKRGSWDIFYERLTIPETVEVVEEFAENIYQFIYPLIDYFDVRILDLTFNCYVRFAYINNIHKVIQYPNYLSKPGTVFFKRTRF